MSRKFLMTAGGSLITFGTASVAWLVLDKMNGAEWAAFCQWMLPAMAAIYAGGNVMEKRG